MLCYVSVIGTESSWPGCIVAVTCLSSPFWFLKHEHDLSKSTFWLPHLKAYSCKLVDCYVVQGICILCFVLEKA